MLRSVDSMPLHATRVCITNGCTTNGGGWLRRCGSFVPPSRDPYRYPLNPSMLRFRFRLRTLFLTCSFAALVFVAFLPFKPSVEFSTPSIEWAQTDGTWYPYARIELTNRGILPIWYYGHSDRVLAYSYSHKAQPREQWNRSFQSSLSPTALFSGQTTALQFRYSQQKKVWIGLRFLDWRGRMADVFPEAISLPELPRSG